MTSPGSKRTLLLTALATAVGCHAIWLGSGHPSGLFWAVTPILVIALAVTAFATARKTRYSVVLHRGVSTVLLGLMAFIVASALVGRNLLSFSAYGEWRYALFLTGFLSLTFVGVALGWFVARWCAMALAFAGVLSAGLNLAPFFFAQSDFSWTLAINVSGALIVLANLTAADVRERYERGASAIWTSSEPMLRWIRFSIVAVLAAIPMLLVYGWMQPVAAQTMPTAIALAAFLSLSVAAAVCRKVIGALGLVIGGCALLVQAAATTLLAYDITPLAGRISLYYAAFWIPAGLVTVFCGIRLARPMVSLLASPSAGRD